MPTIIETLQLCLDTQSADYTASQSLGFQTLPNNSDYLASYYHHASQSTIIIIHSQQALIEKSHILHALESIGKMLDQFRQDTQLAQCQIVHVGYMNAGVYAQLCGYYYGCAVMTYENPGWKKYIELLPKTTKQDRLIHQFAVVSQANTNNQVGCVLSIKPEFNKQFDSRKFPQFFYSTETQSLSLETLMKLFKDYQDFNPILETRTLNFLNDEFYIIDEPNDNEQKQDKDAPFAYEPIINEIIPPGNEDLLDKEGRYRLHSLDDDPPVYFEINSQAQPTYTIHQKKWLISHVMTRNGLFGHSMIIIEGIEPPTALGEKAKLYVGYYHLAVDRETSLARVFSNESDYYQTHYNIVRAVSWKVDRNQAKSLTAQLKQEKANGIDYSALSSIETLEIKSRNKQYPETIYHNCTTWVLNMLEYHASIKSPRISANHVVAKPLKNTKGKNQVDDPNLVNPQRKNCAIL